MSNPTNAFRPPAAKVCNGCKKEKLIKEFNRNNDAPDGRLNKCKACLKKIEDRKKAKQAEYAKTYFTF